MWCAWLGVCWTAMGKGEVYLNGMNTLGIKATWERGFSSSVISKWLIILVFLDKDLTNITCWFAVFSTLNIRLRILCTRKTHWAYINSRFHRCNWFVESLVGNISCKKVISCLLPYLDILSTDACTSSKDAAHVNRLQLLEKSLVKHNPGQKLQPAGC